MKRTGLSNPLFWGQLFWHLIFKMVCKARCSNQKGGKRRELYNHHVKKFIIHTSQILPCQKCRHSYTKFLVNKGFNILKSGNNIEFVFESIHYVNKKLDKEEVERNIIKKKILSSLDICPPINIIDLLSILVMNYKFTNIKYKDQIYFYFLQSLSTLILLGHPDLSYINKLYIIPLYKSLQMYHNESESTKLEKMIIIMCRGIMLNLKRKIEPSDFEDRYSRELPITLPETTTI